MTMPSSGTISLSQANSELGLAATTGQSLGSGAIRTLAGVPGGTISMSDLYGKSAVPPEQPPTIWVASTTGTGTDGNPLYVNYGLGGSPSTVSGWWVAGGDAISESQNSNTQFEFWAPGGNGNTVSGTWRAYTWNGAGTATVDYVVSLTEWQKLGHSCFTGDSLVTMSDGTNKRIDEIQIGDIVATAFGRGEVYFVHKPILAERDLLAMDNGKCKTAAEHTIWSRDPNTGNQWWATRDMQQWVYEAENDFGPNFNGHLPSDLTDKEGLVWEFATLTGWETTSWVKIPASPDTPLYSLRLTTGGSYFIDGYLVSSHADADQGRDWEQFMWAE